MRASCSQGYYKERLIAEISEAQQRLARHRAHPGHAQCVACGCNAPCAAANDAASFLAERGVRLVDTWRARNGSLVAYLRRLWIRPGGRPSHPPAI